MQKPVLHKIFKTEKTELLLKIILTTVLFIFFLPLLILPFFNHPFADDYFCGHQLNDRGFIAYQQFIYNNWGGRFAATFAGSLFAYKGFLFNHYYVHSLLLLILNFCSVFFLLNAIDKYILKARKNLLNKTFFSLLFLAVEICCLPQPSTFIFWFSSAITYHLPLIFTQVELTLFILLFNSTDKIIRIICAVLLPVFIFISVGFNEFFIILQLLFFATGIYFNWHKKYSWIVIALIVFAFLISTALLVFSPGNQTRINEIDAKQFYVGITAVAYHSFQALWNILKNPLLWFILFAAFIYGNQTKEQWRDNSYIQKAIQNKRALIFILFIFLIAAVGLPVALLKGGIIPDRYVNAVTYCMVPMLLIYAFIAGISVDLKISWLQPLKTKILLHLLLVAGLLFNNYITDAYKSLIIAPTYNIILSERENTLIQSAQKNKIATVKDYNAAVSELLETKYKSKSVTFQQLVQQKPPLLFFEDDLATNNSIAVLKSYYKLDSIIIKNR